MIARTDEDGRLTVLGTGQRESRGVKRGYVTDMAASEFAVREAVELAERMSGVTVEEVWASYGAGGLVSDVANVEVELGGHPVEQSDVDELLRGGQEAINRNGQVVLHAIRRFTRSTEPKAFSSRSGFTPTGSGSISTSLPPTRRRCETSIPYPVSPPRVKAIVLLRSPLRSPASTKKSASLASHSSTRRRSHQRVGSLRRDARRVAIDPLGARDITNDIACAFAVQRRDAERLKCFYGSAMTSPRDNHEMTRRARCRRAGPSDEDHAAQLMMVNRQRVEELVSEIESALKGLGSLARWAGSGAHRRWRPSSRTSRITCRRSGPRGSRWAPEASCRPPGCTQRARFPRRWSAWIAAASGRGDIRDIGMPAIQRKSGKGVFAA